MANYAKETFREYDLAPWHHDLFTRQKLQETMIEARYDMSSDRDT